MALGGVVAVSGSLGRTTAIGPLLATIIVGVGCAAGGASEEIAPVADVPAPAVGDLGEAPIASLGQAGGAAPSPIDPPANGAPVEVAPPPVVPSDPGEPVAPGADPVAPARASGCGAATWPESGTHQIVSSNKEREYILRVPDAYDSNRPYRLIFVFHGLGVEPSRIANDWGWNGLEWSGRDDTIFVAPRGQPWNGGDIGWGNAAESIALTEDLLATLQSGFCVDESRIFATGSSYGGIMSNRVGCALGDVFRAIAPIMGNGPGDGFTAPACTGEVAAWITHGRNDSTVPYFTGEASRDHWAAANDCAATTTMIGPDECVEYDGCAPGLPVVWCPTNNGHMDPYFAGAEIAKFFERF